MPISDLTPRQRATALVGGMLVLALVVGLGLLLREYGPGNMGTGFLQGAAVGLAAALGMGWRVRRDPEGASMFERAFTQHGDERDDAVLTQALAQLGLLALPLTGLAAIAIGLGAGVEIALALLLAAQALVLAGAFVRIARRT